MIKVVFCLPGRTFSNYFMESWSNLLFNCPALNVTPFMHWAAGSNVYNVRNLCLGGESEFGLNQKPFQGKIPYDYIMWIDSDSVFTPEQFRSLITQMEENKNLHILSGVYVKENRKELTAVLKWNDSYFDKHGSSKFLRPKDIKGKKGLIKVDFNGMGFMMVRRGVFESLTFPWFQPMGIQNNGQTIGFASEDASFCLRAKEKGFDTFIDPEIYIGHEKPTILR
jgi:GT2 family glycosyltransferase